MSAETNSGEGAELPMVIKRGGKLSQALDPRVFSPVALQMVRVGEESGSLDTMLLGAALLLRPASWTSWPL